MFTSLTVAGLGLDETLALSPSGRTDIARPSMGGKTRLGRALLLLLTGREPWGAAPEPRAGQRIVVEGRTRTMTLRREIWREEDGTLQQIRAFERDGKPLDVTAEKRWVDALSAIPGLTGSPDVIRLLCWPLTWQRLQVSDKDGRAFRDALLGFLDTDKAIAEIVQRSPEWGQDDPTTEKDAMRLRAAASKAASQAAGEATEARAAVARLQPVAAPDGSAVERARALLAVAEEWAGYDRELTAYEDVNQWHLRLEHLGIRPAALADEAISAARERRDTTRRAQADAAAATDGGRLLVRDLRAKLATLAERLADAGEQPAETCGACGQKLPGATRQKALDAWIDRTGAIRRQQDDATRRLTEAEAALDVAIVAETSAESEALAAAEDLETAEEQRRQETAWDASRAAMGPEPPWPKVRSQPPGVPPKDDALAAARALVEQAVRAEGAAGLRGQDLEVVTQRAADLGARAERLQRGAERLDRLVNVIREAPAQLLHHAIAEIGDCGPVTLHPVGSGCEVRIDGHPWQEASQGQLLHADLHLRAALRRAYACRWLPLVVEQAQDWSEDWPEAMGGPLWLLWTRREPGEEG